MPGSRRAEPWFLYRRLTIVQVCHEWKYERCSRMMDVMGIDDTVTSEIVRRILAVANPDRIILFGSAAAGQMTRDSDIDLLIVEPKAANRHEESVKIRSAIGDISFPVDVIVINTERFEATKDIFGGIAYPAHKYGRVLYEVA